MKAFILDNSQASTGSKLNKKTLENLSKLLLFSNCVCHNKPQIRLCSPRRFCFYRKPYYLPLEFL